ncbi:MAG: uroporphyrinogen decarboxylase [Ardenticatenaceae bacterium]|nr:uroporphyrinogen decarboxylase [Ardenticatenaceae bacterium]
MSNWSKRKRLEATLSGAAPDRVPVALWRHWPGDDQDANALAAAHLKWQQDYDWDILKVGPASSYSVVDWGVQDRWVGHIEGTREYIQRPIQQPEDWAKLQPLDPARGMLATQLEALRLVKKAVGDSVPVLVTIFAPLSQAKHLADNEPMITHLRRQPELFRKGQEAITESTLRFIEAAKKIGIDGIFYAIQHARYPLLSRAEYEEWGRPFDHQILSAVQDLWLNMVHLHSTDVMFDLIADYPVQLLNWHDRETGISLADGLQQFKGAASGGVDHWTLHQESPENTLAEVKDAIAQTNGRRLLLGTGCVAMTTTPLRNIRALRESVGQ